MLISFLRHIRSKPKAVRNNYAMLLAGVFTAVVALVWGFTSLQMPAVSIQTTAEETKSAPFANLFGQLKDQLAAAKASFATTSTDQLEANTESETGPGATSTNAQNLQLSPETINQIRQESSSSTIVATTSTQPVFQEVLISTSSKATSTNGGRE